MADEIVTTDDATSPAHTAARGWLRFGIVWVLMAIIIAAGAGVSVMLFERTQMLTTKLITLQQATKTNEQQVTVVSQGLGQLQTATEKSQQLTAQQEKMLVDWQAAQKGNLEKWYVAEAQYLTKLANDYLQFTRDAAQALSLLQRANDVLQSLQDANLVTIRESLAAAIAALQTKTPVDTTELFLKLTALDDAIDGLPLPAKPLKESNALAATNTQAMPWWKAGMIKTWESLKSVVIIRNSGYHTLPLVMPDEKNFFYQNLHAQMASAMWAVLHHQASIYQASVTHLLTWAKQYLDQDDARTKDFIMQLTMLEKIDLQPPAVDLAPTLQQFTAYFTQQPSAT